MAACCGGGGGDGVRLRMGESGELEPEEVRRNGCVFGGGRAGRSNDEPPLPPRSASHHTAPATTPSDKSFSAVSCDDGGSSWRALVFPDLRAPNGLPRPGGVSAGPLVPLLGEVPVGCCLAGGDG